MTNAREQFRPVLSRSDCTLAANIFDPLPPVALVQNRLHLDPTSYGDGYYLRDS